jgi:hypothetical protein
VTERDRDACNATDPAPPLQQGRARSLSGTIPFSDLVGLREKLGQQL